MFAAGCPRATDFTPLAACTVIYSAALFLAGVQSEGTVLICVTCSENAWTLSENNKQKNHTYLKYHKYHESVIPEKRDVRPALVTVV